MTTNNSSLSVITPTQGQQSPVHVKKISRILYEIGSILSFVGIGKDYKQHNPIGPASLGSNTTAFTSSNITLNSPSINETHMTRRSPNKKQTPSSSTSASSNTTTNTTNTTANVSEPATVNSSNLLTPTGSSAMLSPNKTNTHSHSLTRLHKTYPHRFKSLSSHSSNTIDNSTISPPINTTNPNEKLKAANSKEALNVNTITSSVAYNSLSPASARKNLSIGQPSPASFLNTSTHFAQCFVLHCLFYKSRKAFFFVGIQLGLDIICIILKLIKETTVNSRIIEKFAKP